MKNNQNKKNRQPTAEEQFRKMAVLAAGICENRPWEHAGCPGPFVCYYDDGMETYIYILITDDAGNRGFRIYHTRRDYARSCTPYDTREKNLRKDIETVYDAVFFCDWENLPEEEQNTFERLSLRFPDGCWPRFVSKRCGCLTVVPLGSDEYETMEDCLQHFKAQLDAMRESGELARFKQGEVAQRCYDAEAKAWKHSFARTVKMLMRREPLMIEPNALVVQELKKAPYSEDIPEMEMDFGWLIPEHLDSLADGYEFEMLVVLADRESKEVLLEYACDPEAFDVCVVEAIKDVVSEHGKPRTIYVSRDYSADSLCDLARWGNIRLAQVNSVPGAASGLHHEGAVYYRELCLVAR